MVSRRQQIEYGDFQTPEDLALAACNRLNQLGINPDVVVEPTCGVGSFVSAALKAFPCARLVLGYEINPQYIEMLKRRTAGLPAAKRLKIEQADFFASDWAEIFNDIKGSLLVLGNFPWVTNAVQGSIGASNLPEKSNFLKHNGFDAISGKANFDISEWMMLEVLRWFEKREGCLAMLCKTSVARKILAHVERQRAAIRNAFVIRIDAQEYFGASVDACFLVIQFSNSDLHSNYDYMVFENFDDRAGHRVGHRNGLTVGDLDVFESNTFLLGESPRKWRSGIKHDASSVMEFSSTERGLKNGNDEIVDLEPDYLFPLMKGSDVGNPKVIRCERYVLVTQRYVGEPTVHIQKDAPKTWAYLERHGATLDGRGSTIYAKNPRFSIFGVGDYAFQPWRIAICSLYKKLSFQLVGPRGRKPVMFDDTVYYLSFDSEREAQETLEKLNSRPAMGFLSSLIFWDEKRPIKTSILNVLDWSRLKQSTGM